MTHKTIQIEENAQHENESLVMMEREQGDLQQHDHLFFELAYITGGTCEHTLNDIKPFCIAATIFLLISAVHTAMKTAAG